MLSTYDAVVEFSNTTNTESSTWSYRYFLDNTLDGSYDLLPNHDDPVAYWNPPTPYWRAAGDLRPAIGVNRSGSPILTNGTQFAWPNDTIWMNGGDFPAGAVVSWLSPVSGLVDIEFSFTQFNPNEPSRFYFVDHNGSSDLLAHGLIGAGSATGLLARNDVPVNVGDRINFGTTADLIALTATITTEPYAAEVLADDPIAYWRFEEVAGTTAVDSAADNDGTYNGVVLGQPSAFEPLGKAGRWNNSFVAVPSLGAVTDVSIEAWVNASSFSSNYWNSLYNTSNPSTNGSHWQFIRNRFEWALGTSDTDNSFTFSTDTWYHIVTTYNHTTGVANLYVNGQFQETLFVVPGIQTSLTEGAIGTWNDRFFDGLIDEVAVYDVTLSPDRIAAHFDAARGLVSRQGDYNQDGAVDAADYVVWRKTLGTMVTPNSGADGDGSGGVDQNDYGVWRANFGARGPGITVTPTSGLQTTEAGGAAQFTVVLDSQPTADVTIGLSSSDTTEGTVSPNSLTFTRSNWNIPQEVTVTGQDDVIADGDIAYMIITAAAVSGDPAYSGREAADVAVINFDDDLAESSSGLISAAQGGMLSLSKGMLTFPAGAFPADQLVTFSRQPSTESSVQDLLHSMAIFDNGPTRFEEFLIDTGFAQPDAEILVTLKVPDLFLMELGEDYTPALFVKAFWQGDEEEGGEVLDVFEPVPAMFDSITGELVCTIPDWSVTSLRNETGTYEAIMVIGSAPVPATTNGMSQDQFLSGMGSGGDELGNPLYAPLAGLTRDELRVTSQFGTRTHPILGTRRFHNGADIVSNKNGINVTRVVPAASGWIVTIGYDERSVNGRKTGYGQYVVIVDENGDYTRYAHLMPGSIEAANGRIGYPQAPGQNPLDLTDPIRVEGGTDTIGIMGKSGGATAEHLHFEYNPEGWIADPGRTDPMPWITRPPAGVPEILVESQQLNFAATEGGPIPASQSILVTNSGSNGSQLNYTVSDDADWLSVSTTTGSLVVGTSQVHTVSVVGGRPPGIHHATIIVRDLRAINDPIIVPVTLTVLSAPTIRIDDPQPKNEGPSGATNEFVFPVTLSRPLSEAVTITYSTADGSATVADNDYTPQSDVLTFEVGETSKTIRVLSKGDGEPEPDESFFVNLTLPTSPAFGINNRLQASATILNDDQDDDQGTVHIDDASLVYFGDHFSGVYLQVVANGTATGPVDGEIDFWLYTNFDSWDSSSWTKLSAEFGELRRDLGQPDTTTWTFVSRQILFPRDGPFVTHDFVATLYYEGIPIAEDRKPVDPPTLSSSQIGAAAAQSVNSLPEEHAQLGQVERLTPSAVHDQAFATWTDAPASEMNYHRPNRRTTMGPLSRSLSADSHAAWLLDKLIKRVGRNGSPFESEYGDIPMDLAENRPIKNVDDLFETLEDSLRSSRTRTPALAFFPESA